MFPIRDLIHRRHFPVINWLIIVANFIVFFHELAVPNFNVFVDEYALIPAHFHWLSLDSYKYIIYSMFIHGGWFHIGSNMWFLHVFGDSVEDRLGHIFYLLFYLIAGFAAAFFQLLFSLGSTIPMIGASGAIAGVLGAYIVLFRQSRIQTLIFFIIILDIIYLPAWLFIGYWFLIQAFSGLGTLATFDVNQGGVAYFAHIGGFIFGYLLVGRL